MREHSLHLFFACSLSADELATEATSSVRKMSALETIVEIEDMTSDCSVSRQDMLSLCKAALDETLPSEAISAIAFMMLASDHFQWDDETISEILHCWSCPEVNYPLISSTFQMHRRWLLGPETPPERSRLTENSAKGNLISIRRKTSPAGRP
jgi:hypothetical protein